MGELIIKLQDEDIVLNEGEFYIIPRGEEHMPVAEEEVHILLFEPKGTLNTGNEESDKTVKNLKEI